MKKLIDDIQKYTLVVKSLDEFAGALRGFGKTLWGLFRDLVAGAVVVESAINSVLPWLKDAVLQLLQG